MPDTYSPFTSTQLTPRLHLLLPPIQLISVPKRQHNHPPLLPLLLLHLKNKTMRLLGRLCPFEVRDRVQRDRRFRRRALHPSPITHTTSHSSVSERGGEGKGGEVPGMRGS